MDLPLFPHFTLRLSLFSALLLLALNANANETVRGVILTDQLSHPWGMAFLSADEILITERVGRLRRFVNGKLLPKAIEGLPEISAIGQGGLLDIALHPDYPNNGWIYLSYVAGDGDGIGTEVVRGKLKGDRLQQIEKIFTLLPKSKPGYHFGSRIAFDHQGYLYITLGDRGDRPRAQDLADHAGSVIRLHGDGSIPTDNPFYNQKGKRAEIYSYGHRNLQGATTNPKSGAIWTHEHGPQGGDEINIIHSGANYGWPIITYGVNYGSGTPIGEGKAKAGVEQPLYYWVPSIAPSGMTFYSGDKIPQWQGDLFVGSLKFQLLVRLGIQEDKVISEERLFEGEFGRIRDVRTGVDGYLYLLTDADRGKLIRLENAP
ncbi:MAG: PQQ-dependent sugar dehydrogenase [Gammaproteobacteria bacterium]|nr:PQQ-dependent sugar dehydrogenase [Gammaproteobacteria bacterium]